MGGTNTRRIKGALCPQLRDAPLSKDAGIRSLYMDGWFARLRLGKQRVVVPVLVRLGVRGDGERVLLDMRLAGAETTTSWGDVVADLSRRGVGIPELAIIDGNGGLHAALCKC